MALAKRSVEVVIHVMPGVKKHFETVFLEKYCKLKPNHAAEQKIASIAATSSNDARQLDALFRQLDLSVKHLSNHAEELEKKMLSVAEYALEQQLSKWNPQANTTVAAPTIPSANFKALCKQMTKLHESVADIWTAESVRDLMLKVHERFISSVKVEVRSRNLQLIPDKDIGKGSVQLAPQLANTRRALMSEITFYANWLLRLDVIPPELLEQAKLVEQIFLVPQGLQT